MAEQGLQSLVPLQDLAVMGFAEVVPKLPRILRRQAEIARAIVAARPEVIVTIDSSSFNKGVAKRVIRAGLRVPRVHYVAPMVWAWRPGRVHAMAKLFDHLLALFPFEPPLFEAAGLPTTYVGHPAVETDRGDGAAFRTRHRIAADTPLLCLLPGSRSAEVSQLLPRFHAAALLVQRRLPQLALVVPTVGTVAGAVAASIRDWNIPTIVVEGDREKRAAFAASNAALAASGTVTLELALADVPMVVAYRPNPISGWIAARLIRIPHASLVNIILGRALVPELLRSECRPELMAEQLLTLLAEGGARQALRHGFVELRARLDVGGRRPSTRAADVVLALAAGRQADQIPMTHPGAHDERRHTATD